MKFFLLTIICLLGFLFSNAQMNKCSFPFADDQSLYKIRKTNFSTEKTTTLIFPVVFHVIHNYGAENVPDSILHNSITYTNEDFSGLFVDTTEISNWFDTIIGLTNFEFRLATIDPNGNPTNGIERIVSAQTSNPDVSIFANNWDESKYINVYVFKNRADNLFPYTMYQNGTCGRQLTVNARNLSPMLMENNCLSHEMGHFFGLFHTFGDEFTCDDGDGLTDTPYQRLTFGGCLINNNVCNDSIYPSSFAYWGQDPPENTQNIMGWADCQLMFTKQQSALMRANALNFQYDLWNLHTDSNLIATGVGPNAYVPSTFFEIDFWHSSTVICDLDSVQFSPLIGGVPALSYSWTFSGGSPALSNDMNPKILYTNSGVYPVQLIVNNGITNDTVSKNITVTVLNPVAEHSGPFLYDFDGNYSNWVVVNSEDSSSAFEVGNFAGVFNSNCFVLTNDFDEDTTQACWYSTSAGTLGENIDALISPSFNLNPPQLFTISFDYAYGTAAQINTPQFSEELKLLVSTDCGETWQVEKDFQDAELFCNTANMGSNYVPSASDWKYSVINYQSTNADNRTRFMLVFKSSNYSNNLYIDNFAVNRTLSTSFNQENQFFVHPNPISNTKVVHIETVNNSAIESVFVISLEGKKEEVFYTNEFNFLLPEKIGSGFYLLQINSKNTSETHKIQVLNE